MRVTFLLFFLTFNALSQPAPRIEVIANPKSIEDFDHQYKGCLENSECDQVMGLQLTRWKELIKKLKDEKMEGPKKAQFLELYRQKYGLPVEFYTGQKSQLGYRPLLFNSPCKEHNLKDKEKILRGISFIKSISKDKAMVWRDQTQVEVPVGELLRPQTISLYNGQSVTDFLIPIGDQPLFVKDKNIYLLKEEDSYFYILKISPEGEWRVEHLDFTTLNQYEEKRSEVSCPKEIKKGPTKDFGIEYCKTIWDEDTKKTVIVRLHQGCI